MGERPVVAPAEKFKTPEEELAYLRERVKQKEDELEKTGTAEQERLTHREVKAYAETPPATILHESVVLPK
jgi:hypothetical protein